jgi:hypothetical protein
MVLFLAQVICRIHFYFLNGVWWYNINFHCVSKSNARETLANLLFVYWTPAHHLAVLGTTGALFARKETFGTHSRKTHRASGRSPVVYAQANVQPRTVDPGFAIACLPALFRLSACLFAAATLLTFHVLEKKNDCSTNATAA